MEVCFLDVKKAFDCVWHDGLFYKLCQSGNNKVFCKLIINMYTDMHSCKGLRIKSNWFHVRQGTRQGTRQGGGYFPLPVLALHQ